jgi:hypothetical protein
MDDRADGGPQPMTQELGADPSADGVSDGDDERAEANDDTDEHEGGGEEAEEKEEEKEEKKKKEKKRKSDKPKRKKRAERADATREGVRVTEPPLLRRRTGAELAAATRLPRQHFRYMAFRGGVIRPRRDAYENSRVYVRRMLAALCRDVRAVGGDRKRIDAAAVGYALDRRGVILYE